jgi:hypothetical protein
MTIDSRKKSDLHFEANNIIKIEEKAELTNC